MFVEFFRRLTSAPGHSNIGIPPETYDKRNGTSPRLPQSSQCQQVDRHLPGQKLDRWMFLKDVLQKMGGIFCPTFLDMVKFGELFFVQVMSLVDLSGIFHPLGPLVSDPPGQREVVGTFLCNGHAAAIAGFAGLCTWSDVCTVFDLEIHDFP